MRGAVRVLFFIASFLIFVSSGFALPRFALTTGAKCGACHFNPTGGQLRSDYGTTFGMDKLPIRATNTATSDSLRDEESSDDFVFNPKISENITIGADYRSQFIYDQESKTSSFHMMTMSLYGGVTLGKRVSFFFKQDIANPTYGTLSGPEAFGLIKLSSNWYIKGGDFLPDYGWRIDDHTAYVRGGDLGFTPLIGHLGLLFVPNYKDIGVEIGGSAGGLSMTAGLFNGTGDARKLYFEQDKAYTAKIEYIGKGTSVNYRIGVTGYGYRTFKMGGVMAGIGIGDFTLSGELDVTHHRMNPFVLATVDETGHSMAAFGEATYRVVQGVWLVGRYDTFDPTRGIADDEYKRVTIGGEIFPFAFVEVRPQYRINLETPSVDNNQGLVQMHVWF